MDELSSSCKEKWNPQGQGLEIPVVVEQHEPHEFCDWLEDAFAVHGSCVPAGDSAVLSFFQKSSQSVEDWMRWDGWENLSVPEILTSIKADILKSFFALESCQFPFCF